MRVVKTALQTPVLFVGGLPKRTDVGTKKGPSNASAFVGGLPKRSDEGSKNRAPNARILGLREPQMPEILAFFHSFNTQYLHRKNT